MYWALILYSLWLCWVFATDGLSLVAASWGCSDCGVGVSPCRSFPCCGAWATLHLHLHLGSLHFECSAGSIPGAQCLSSFPEVPWLPCLMRGQWLVGGTVGPASPNRTTRLHLISARGTCHLTCHVYSTYFPAVCPIPPPRMQGPFPFYLHQNCGHLSTQYGAWLWARRTGSPCFMDKDGTTWHVERYPAGPSGPSCNRLPRPPPHPPPAPRS